MTLEKCEWALTIMFIVKSVHKSLKLPYLYQKTPRGRAIHESWKMTFCRQIMGKYRSSKAIFGDIWSAFSHEKWEGVFIREGRLSE